MTSQQMQYGRRPPFWEWFCRYISAANHPASTKFSMQMQGLVPRTVAWQKKCKLKMADGRQFENRLLATSVLTIARLTRNFVCERRIIVGHRLHNQDNKFRKFEMVDGANMKMILSLCLPRIMGFRWYLVCLCRFWFQEWSRVTNLNNWMK